MKGTFETKKQEQDRQAPQGESLSATTYPSQTIVHAKLEMTDPGDRDEQEADAVANEIVSGGKIARKVSGGGGSSGMHVPRQMESRLMHLHGTGLPMPQSLQSMMEGAFGQEFPHVRLHTDSEAASMSSSIRAKAFTHGNDIYFNRGQFAPDTADGQRLIAHELTHVVQGGGRVARETEVPQPATETDIEQPTPGNDAQPPVLEGEGSLENGEEYAPESEESILQIQPSETDRIKRLRTRRERALYLFGDKADIALAKQRVFKSGAEAEANMERVHLKVLGREGKEVTIGMRVHHKLANYVQEMFAEIKKAYSAPDNKEVFLFDETDRARGGFNWRYKRDDVEDNLGVIDSKYNAIDNLKLDAGVLEEAQEIAAISGSKQRAAKVQELKSKYKTGTKSADNDFNKRIDDAIEAYRKINEYRELNANIEKRTNELEAKNEQLRAEIDALKTQRDQLGKEYEEIHHRIKTIEGIRDGKRLSSGLWAEMQSINSESGEKKDDLKQLLKEKWARLQEYREIQAVRNTGSQTDIKTKKEKLKKDRKNENSKSQLDLLYKSSDTIEAEIGGLMEDIALLARMIAFGFDSDREKALGKSQEKRTRQDSMEKELSENFFHVETFTGDSLIMERQVLNKKTVQAELKKEVTKEDTIKRRIDKIDNDIQAKEKQIKDNDNKMPGYRSTLFSEHGAGVAMDINPKTNPFYEGYVDAPNMFWEGEADKEENAQYYVPRRKQTLDEWRDYHRGKDKFAIKPGSKLVKIFLSYGWKWGGEWGSRDYMHFEWFSKTWPREDKTEEDKKKKK